MYEAFSWGSLLFVARMSAYFITRSLRIRRAIQKLHDNLSDALDLLTFLLGISRACRIEESLI